MTQRDPRLQRLQELIERQVVAKCANPFSCVFTGRLIQHLNGTIEAAWPAIMRDEATCCSGCGANVEDGEDCYCA